MHAAQVFVLSASLFPLKRHTGNGFPSWKYCYVCVAHIPRERCYYLLLVKKYYLFLVLQLYLSNIDCEAASSLRATEELTRAELLQSRTPSSFGSSLPLTAWSAVYFIDLR